MKSSRVNYIIVGSFTLAMVTGIVVSVMLLTGRTGATDDYFTTYEDATGLKFGSKVFYMGYPGWPGRSDRTRAGGRPAAVQAATGDH